MDIRHPGGQPVSQGTDPFGGFFQLVVDGGIALKGELYHHVDGADEQPIGQAVKNSAPEAEEKSSAIRMDESPELAEK